VTFDFQQALRQRHGAVGEHAVAGRLRVWGFVLVEKVHTPWKVQFGPGGRVMRAWPVEKVCGDFRAVMPPHGRSVLVEVKSREAGPLSWSDFESHQHDAMVANANAGGLSLVGWTRPGACMIFEYGRACDAGWKNRAPLQPDVAMNLATDTHARIVQAMEHPPVR